MQRDLHLRLTGRRGQADCRGREAEASSFSPDERTLNWGTGPHRSLEADGVHTTCVCNEQMHSTSTLTDTHATIYYVCVCAHYHWR